MSVTGERWDLKTVKVVTKKSTITKTVRQYSAKPIPSEVMEKLLTIAADYRTVKNYVYQRYGGIRSISKLYPGYTVQNEMTKSGLRKQMGLPGAYFYLAMFEALVDIRNRWDREKDLVGQRIRNHGAFSEADRHYLQFLLSVEKIFAAVLNRQPMEFPLRFRKQYEVLSGAVDTHRLENYLRRQIRKVHARPKADNAYRFSATVDGYRYGDHGIYLATKEYRKRVFIPLTDNNGYARQIEIKLRPEQSSLEIQVPIEIRVRRHEDYSAEIGLAMGMHVMLTTHEGHAYGEEIEKYHKALSTWMREEHIKYQKNCGANSGRKKYEAKKRRLEGHLHSYINRELNRFLRTEKPRKVSIMRFPQGNKRYGEKSIGHSVHTWQRGYIRKQLVLKCREHSVELVEVFGKDIGVQCSRCGKIGRKENGIFSCECGFMVPEKQNTAQNAKNRGSAPR